MTTYTEDTNLDDVIAHEAANGESRRVVPLAAGATYAKGDIVQATTGGSSYAHGVIANLTGGAYIFAVVAADVDATGGVSDGLCIVRNARLKKSGVRLKNGTDANLTTLQGACKVEPLLALTGLEIDADA